MGRALIVLPGVFAVCRLDRDAADPGWLETAGFRSVTRTDDELSIVCDAEVVPADVRAVRDWRALRVEGVLDFAETGVLSSIATPLAGAGVSLFAVSTHDTDYVLVRQADLERAVVTLRGAGFAIESFPGQAGGDQQVR